MVRPYCLLLTIIITVLVVVVVSSTLRLGGLSSPILCRLARRGLLILLLLLLPLLLLPLLLAVYLRCLLVCLLRNIGVLLVIIGTEALGRRIIRPWLPRDTRPPNHAE